MKFSTSFLATLMLAAPSIAANVVSLDFSKTQTSSPKHKDSVKRSTITENATNWGVEYFATVKVGTPPQKLTLGIDTGSADTWVMSNTYAADCKDNDGVDDCFGGFFASKKSSTYKQLDADGFYIEYLSGQGASGPFFEDDLVIGGVTLKSQQMGLGKETAIQFGTLALSYTADESRGPDGKSPTYPSVMDQLVKQKIINTPVYSLWLDDLEATTGSILFGGVDTEKFTGELLSTPVLEEGTSGTKGYYSFNVSLKSIGINGPGKSSLNVPVTLDSGTTSTYLPMSVIRTIAKAYNLSLDNPGDSSYNIDCDVVSKHPNDYFEYQFDGEQKDPKGNGPVIRVPLSQVVVDLETYVSVTKNSTYCAIMVSPTVGGFNILGDSFLRSAYAVYDLKNHQVGLAQAYFKSKASSIVEIEANATGIPLLCGKNDPKSAAVVTANDTAVKRGSQYRNPTKRSSASDNGTPGFRALGSLVVVLGGVVFLH